MLAIHLRVLNLRYKSAAARLLARCLLLLEIRMQREIVVLGVNHNKAPVEIREQLAFRDGALEDGLARLQSLAPVDESAIISTCNRVEVVATTGDGDASVEALTTFLTSRNGTAPASFREYLSVYRGREAARHLFRVAASLESMVVGEPQILGQLKDAYGRAAIAGSTGTVLHRCFHKAFSVAKRVRTETAVANKAVSVSSAAIALAGKIFDRFEDKTAMLIGAGTMSELAARHLLGRGIGHLLVTNRTFERAADLARGFSATAVRFDDFQRHLAAVDVVIGSVGADHHVLTRPQLDAVMRLRKYRPMFLIDLSVPRTFDPGANDIDNLYLYDIDDLGRVAAANRDERSREAQKAEAIVEEEVEAFWKWLVQLDAVPTIVALRAKLETIRKSELEKTLLALDGLSPHHRACLEAMTAAIVNKTLHAPITHLKRHDPREEAFYLAAARQLFDIEEPAGPRPTLR